MSRRSSLRSPVRAFVFVSGIGLWVACSSDSTDFFGPPIPAAGKAGQAGSGTASGGTAGSGAGHGGASTAATGGTHVGGSTGGSDPSAGAGNPSGGSPDAGAPASGGVGGNGGAGGKGGSGGAGLASGTGGEAGDIGSAGAQAGDGGAPGGSAGEPSVGGTSGTGGSTGGAGTGGTAGGGMGGTAGVAGVAGSGGQPPVTCGGDPECAPTEYCKKTSCNAAKGTCTVRPLSCTSGADATFDPVCGCDQFTYYTACVAAREGVNVAQSGECNTGSPCTRTGGSGDSCNPHRNRAACYRTRPNCAGTAPNEGVCWVLPDVCPQEEAVHLYCNSGGTPECHGLCDALESKYPLVMNSNQCN